MRSGTILLCGFLVLLMVCVIPVAADSVLANGNADNGDRPTVLVEYGTGKNFGLVRVTHIHYIKPVDKVRPAKAAACYKLAGWKWSGPVQYYVAPFDPAYPSRPSLLDAVGSAGMAWNDSTSRDLFVDPVTEALPYSSDAPDYYNSVSYGDSLSSGIIAVTNTWYYRATKTAIDSDILFNAGYSWGDATATPGVMDLQNIATHEIGHTLGLSDLYTESCSQVTMFGYSEEDDTAKRTLETADIAGLRRLYGP